MGKPKKVEVDDDDAVFAQRAIELKGARPAAHAQSPREIFPLVGSRPVVPALAAPKDPRVPDRPPPPPN